MLKTTLRIDGMMCGHCEAHVNDAIRRDFKVKKVTSSHTAGETVILSDAAPDEVKLRATVEACGYRVLGLQTEPVEKKGWFGR